MSNQDDYQRYLKYKRKYLRLKQQKGGQPTTEMADSLKKLYQQFVQKLSALSQNVKDFNIQEYVDFAKYNNMLNSSIEDILEKFSQTASTEAEKAQKLLLQIKSNAQEAAIKGQQVAQPYIDKSKETYYGLKTQAQQAAQPITQDVSDYLRAISEKVKAAFQTGGQEMYLPYFIEIDQRMYPFRDMQIVPLDRRPLVNQVASFIMQVRANPSWDAILNARQNIDNLYMQLNMALQPWTLQVPISQVPLSMVAVPIIQ